MLESLTPEMEKRLPEIAQFWIERSLQTGPSDRSLMEGAVRQVYRSVGLEEPSLIVWVGSPYGGQIVGNLLENNGKEYWEQIKDCSLEELEKILAENKEISPHFLLNCDGQFDSHWVSFYDFFYELGIIGENKEWFEAMKVLTQTGWWTPFEDFVVMTERPDFIKLNGLGQLHSLDGPAIQYPDGWGFYSIDGTRVPGWIIMESDKITPQTIFKEDNLEIRRVMCEIYGWENLTAEENGFKLLNSCPDAANGSNVLYLYSTPEELFGEVRVNILLCTNATPETDGKIRQFGLVIPEDIKDAREAVAWTFGTTADEYFGLQRAG